MSAQVAALREVRQLLAERFPDARPLVERDAARIAAPVATGVSMLDDALPHGGLPRGKLTAWMPAAGAAAVLRSACRAVLAQGERAAWIDGSRTFTFGWAAHGSAVSAGDAAQPLIVLPRDRLDALRCTELLLRSGAFALVVLDLPPGSEAIGTETVRLTRAAREGGAAFVALTERAAMAAVRVASRLTAHGVRWRHGPFGPAAAVEVRTEVRVRALGWNARAVVQLPVATYDVRDALDPHVPDRRGGG